MGYCLKEHLLKTSYKTDVIFCIISMVALFTNCYFDMGFIIVTGIFEVKLVSCNWCVIGIGTDIM